MFAQYSLNTSKSVGMSILNTKNRDTTNSIKHGYERLLYLLGPNVVLIPCHYGSKVSKISGWNKLSIECMKDSKHLKMLECSNIAVKVGSSSSGLCSIDIDDDSQYQAFLNLNPALKETLQTKGQRGEIFGCLSKGIALEQRTLDLTILGTSSGGRMVTTQSYRGCIQAVLIIKS